MDARAAAMEEVVAAIRETDGETGRYLRAAVEAHAAGSAGPEIPEALRGYVDTVTRHAYRTTDQAVEQLTAAGYSEDAIFEITLAAALGAARARLDAGLAALEEATT